MNQINNSVPTYSMQSKSDPVLSVDIARFICGGIAGTVSRTMTAPIDRLKVLRQIEAQDMLNKSMLDSWRIMIREGGVLSLWRGNGVNVLKNCPESAIRFGLHGLLKSVIFPDVKGPLKPTQRLLVAGLAGASSLTLTYPIEVMKTRMAMRRSADPSSIVICLKRIYQEGGLRGFYRGYKISMLSYVPYSGMELALYEMLKLKYLQISMKKNSKEQVHMAAHIAIPLILISSCIPMLIIYPANLLRTRYQASKSPIAAPILSSFYNVLKTNGFTGLYRGLSASLSKTLPTVCITYLVFEFTSELMGIPGLGTK